MNTIPENGSPNRISFVLLLKVFIYLDLFRPNQFKYDWTIRSRDPVTDCKVVWYFLLHDKDYNYYMNLVEVRTNSLD